MIDRDLRKNFILGARLVLVLLLSLVDSVFLLPTQRVQAISGMSFSVTTQAVTNIGPTAATANGNISLSTGVTVDKRGFVYSASSHDDPSGANPQDSGYEYEVEEATGNFGAGPFSLPLNGLSPRTTYYVRAYVCSTWCNYGEEVSFTTADSIPSRSFRAGGWAPMSVGEVKGGFKVLINNGTSSTNSSKVTLQLIANPQLFKRMRISNDYNFSSERSTGVISYQSSYQWNLCKGLTSCSEGPHHVYVRYYTYWGRPTEVVSDSIIYRKEKPIIKVPVEELQARIVELKAEIAKLQARIAQLKEAKKEIFHLVAKGETLWQISQRYLGSATR